MPSSQTKDNYIFFPKSPSRKKRKKHAKSILQPKEEKRCYLCMTLDHDYREKPVQEHHAIYGTANRAKSEEWGLQVNLCYAHHLESKTGVHHNKENRDILKRLAQKEFIRLHGHEKYMQEFGKNNL